MRCVFAGAALVVALAAPVQAGAASSGSSAVHVSAPVHVSIPPVTDPHAPKSGGKHPSHNAQWIGGVQPGAVANYKCWTTVYEQNGPFLIPLRVLTQGAACPYNELFWTTRLDSGGLIQTAFPSDFSF
jgi:hypothetical protein